MFAKVRRHRRSSAALVGRLALIMVLTGVVALAALAAGCGGSNDKSSDKSSAPAEDQAAEEVDLPSGRIAFRRFLDETQTHGAIFTINPDGTGEKQLTHPPTGVVDDQPDWSPDGKQIAFSRCSEGEPCWAYTVAADGGEPEKVRARCNLKPICDLETPVWTPDGKLLVTVAPRTRYRRRGADSALLTRAA